MTKIKNTKKGMAKKTLSMSLVVAMLATSNVPVWAAEFSDGTEAAVETFSDEAESAPVVENSIDNSASAQSETTGSGYSISTSYEAVKEVEVGKTLGTGDTITVTPENELPSNITLKMVWKADGLSVSTPNTLNKQADGTYTFTMYGYDTKVDDCNKSVVLYVYAEDSNTGNAIWSYSSDATKVEAVDISDAVKVKDSIASPTYDSKEHKLGFTDLFETINSSGFTADDVNLSYSGDLTNVTKDGVTVTLTPTKEGYKGSITANYKISPIVINGEDADHQTGTYMTATLINSSFAYTGSAIRVKKEDISLVDLNTGADLSSYLYVDKDGYVGTAQDDGINAGNDHNVKVNLIIGQPESGCMNYIITDDGNTDETNINYNGTHRKANVSTKLSVTKRDLSTVNVTIPAQTGSQDGKPITIDPSKLTFTDKTTGETLALSGDVKVEAPSNAINKGTYTATISAADSTDNVTGETTATFNIVAADLSSATFKNESTITSTCKAYTGEQITFTTDELGALVDVNGNVIDPSLYEITFGENINAKDGDTSEGVIIVKGLGSFEGSEKRVYFDITPASLDKANTKANDYVEIIDTKNYSDYASEMGIVVKATNTDGKSFTLTEGTDYTVEYDCTDNTKDGEVTAKITIINDSFKGGDTTVDVSSTITEKALKDENIKLKTTSYVYTGKPVQPEFDIVIDGKVINPDLYTTAVVNNVNAGTATITVTGKGDVYSDQASAKATFTISPEETSKLEGSVASQEYKGYSLTPGADQMEITLNGEKIDISKDFTLSYGENINIGEGTVTLTPKTENFTGTKTFTFQITGEMLQDGGTFKYYNANGIEVTDKSFNYDGTAHTYTKTVFTYNGDKKLTEGTDYDLVYVDNIYGKKINSVQTGVVLAVAKGQYGGNYTDNTLGTETKNGIYTDAAGNTIANVIAVDTFTIEPQNISLSNVAVANGVYAAGLPVNPVVSIIVNGVTLIEGTDYDLDLTANNNITQATTSNELTVTIVPKNGYKTSDSLTFNWGIDKFNLANADVTVDGDNVTVKCGRVDVETSEYTVTKEDSKVTVTANSDSKNYTGSKTVDVATEDIKPAAPMISNVKVFRNGATAVLSGESDGASGYDYVISTDRDCITNKNYYSISKNQVKTSTSFKYVDQGIYYAYCHAWTRDENGKKVFSDWSNAYPFVVSAITPDAPVITSVKVSGSTIKVTYDAAANATGYDVVLGTSSKKENGETRPYNYGAHKKLNIKEGTVTATFKNIPAGTWVVGMHAFNRTSEDGGKVFSPWSNLKKATVK